MRLSPTSEASDALSTGRRACKQSDKQTGRQTGRRAGRQADLEKEREREKEKERVRYFSDRNEVGVRAVSFANAICKELDLDNRLTEESKAMLMCGCVEHAGKEQQGH